VSALPGVDKAFPDSHYGVDFQKALRHSFRRPELLEKALTHTSHAREVEAQTSTGLQALHNEQMEFLGDAVLGFVAAEELCRRFPNSREGELSKLRAHLISEKHLVTVARELRVGNYLRLGKGEEKSGGRAKTAILVDALEATIAALYLDGGIDLARDFIIREIIGPELSRIANSGSNTSLTDYKSALQEKLQAMGRAQIVYTLAKQSGPDHRKTFTVEARLSDLNEKHGAEYVARAEGPTKKSAEQSCAQLVLEHLASVKADAP
jgi:ribonuclease-3